MSGREIHDSDPEAVRGFEHISWDSEGGPFDPDKEPHSEEE